MVVLPGCLPLAAAAFLFTRRVLLRLFRFSAAAAGRFASGSSSLLAAAAAGGGGRAAGGRRPGGGGISLSGDWRGAAPLWWGVLSRSTSVIRFWGLRLLEDSTVSLLSQRDRSKIFGRGIFVRVLKVKGDFLGLFYVMYSTLFHLPSLRFHCVGGCWDRTQDSCDYGIDCQRLYHSARSHPHSSVRFSIALMPIGRSL
jgi:hypothetical protein